MGYVQSFSPQEHAARNKALWFAAAPGPTQKEEGSPSATDHTSDVFLLFVKIFIFCTEGLLGQDPDLKSKGQEGPLLKTRLILQSALAAGLSGRVPPPPLTPFLSIKLTRNKYIN